MTAPPTPAESGVTVTLNIGKQTFRTQQDIRDHIADLARFIPALPDDDCGHPAPGKGTMTDGQAVEALARVTDMAGLRAMLIYVHGYCPNAFEDALREQLREQDAPRLSLPDCARCGHPAAAHPAGECTTWRSAAGWAMDAPDDPAAFCGVRYRHAGQWHECDEPKGHDATGGHGDPAMRARQDAAVAADADAYRASVAAETCPASHPLDGVACSVRGPHDVHSYTPFAFAGNAEPETWTDADTLAHAIDGGQPVIVEDVAEKCGARPYPAGSEGDDGTGCVLPKYHAGPHDDGVPAPLIAGTAS